MISVVVTTLNDQVNSISVSGHALSANYGEDLVCAGVSSIVFGALNSFEQLVNDKVNLLVLENEIKIEVIKYSLEVEILMKALIIQLETIQNSYQENINILREVLT